MSTISAGNPALARPELTKAIESIAAKARKQFDETGSLAGFSGDYTTESGDGKISLSISSTATALYDKSAGKDDFVLQYRLQSQGAAGGGSSHGSTLTIDSDADIDQFARNLIATTTQRGFNQGFGGSPETIEALINSLQPTKGAVAPAAETPTDPRLKALQESQASAAGLVSALEDFVSGLKGIYQQQNAYQTGWQPTETDGQKTFKELQVLLDIRV